MCVRAGFYPAVVANLNEHQRADLLSCRTECKGMLITLVFKMILLVIGSWAVFLRRPRATMPRIFLFRSAILLLVLICCVAYWLFYFVQITEGKFTRTLESLAFFGVHVGGAEITRDDRFMEFV